MLTIHGGRTRRLWKELEAHVASARSAGRRCVLLVPEQYTLQAERDLIAGLHLPGFFDIEVFSLSRFVQRLFLISGAGNRVRVDGNGKNIALSRALMSCKKKLKYYARSTARQGFIAQSGEWIADMKRADVTPQKLAEYAAGLEEGAYRDKISDLSHIYSAYSEIMADKFVDGEDVLQYAVDQLPASGLVDGTDVFVYGFDIITDDFARLLCAVARACESVHVYLVMDREEAADGDCFVPVRQSAERLRLRLRAANLHRQWLWVESKELDAPDDIRYLEKCMLRAAAPAFAQVPQHIALFEAATPYAEAHFIAQEILSLLEKGVEPQDIAVLSGDMGQYAPVLDAVLRSYDIPFYLAVKEPLQSHGLVRLVLSAVRAATGGYRSEDVLALIKSGFAPLSPEEAWALENYMLAYGVRGKKLLASFARGSEEERRVPEEARQKIMPALTTLQSALAEAENAAESLKALVDYMAACDAYHTLLRQEEMLMQCGMDAQAVRARQVWNKLLALLEQMHEIAGGARIPGRTVTQWLEAGLMDESLSALPPSSGCVMVGEIGNLIAVEPRAVFACGLHSGMNESTEKSLLTVEEKASASNDMQAYLGMNADERDLMAELDVWKALCATREMLYLSYAQATQAGAAQRSAQVVAGIRRLFPQMTVLGGIAASQGALHPHAPMPALDEMGQRLRTGTLSGQWLETWKWLVHAPEYRDEALRVLSCARSRNVPEALPPALSRELFPDRLVSISRLEQYAACPYGHFVEYGLRPQERREWAVTPADKGNFYHAAMEDFTRALAEHPAWPDMSREMCDELMDKVLAPLTAQWDDMAMGDTARARAESKRYINVCKRVAWAFTKGAKASKFRPDGGEVSFGYPGGPPPLVLRLSDGTRVSVRGRIDRIDRYDSGDGEYLRVVDYKSGTKVLDPARIHMGMQLQLLLYLEAALHQQPGAQPAGAFYQWMGDPMVDQAKKSMIESEIAKRLCLKGVMLSDVQVAQWMDENTPPVGIEDVFKKDGTPKKGKLVCSLEEMYQLISVAHDTAVKLTEEIRWGSIAASPVCEKSGEAHCRYCDYAGVCRRDERIRAHDRMLEDISVEDLLQKNKPNA